MSISTSNVNDMESVQPNRPPRLVNGETFEDWKRCLKAFFFYTDYNQWESIVNGPHMPKKVEGTVTLPNNDPSTYTEGDIKLFDRDKKALGALILCLHQDIYNRFVEHTSAKSLYDALCEFYDGNEDLKLDRKVQLRKSLIHLEYNQSMMLPNVPPQNAALITFATNSHIYGAVYGGSSSFGSVKSDGASTSVGSGSNAYVSTQIPSDTIALFGMFVHSYEALVAGELKGKGMTVEDMYQVDPDDLEETDIQWQMAMLTLRARRFMERTGRRNFGNQGQNNKLGYDKGKLRCYNYKQLGHFKRECPLPIVTEPVNSGNSRTVPIQDRAEEVKLRKETALLTNFDWSVEIEETKEEINHALIVEIVEEHGENSDKAAESKVVMVEEVQDGKDQEAIVTVEVHTDVIVQGHLGQEENADTKAENAEESKLNMEAMIEKAKHEAVNEYKRNTPYCQCERALAAEKLQVTLAEFETRKVKNKLEQWTISSMKREDLCKKQQGARIKTGLGYKNDAQIEIDRILVSKVSKVGLKSHCFKCGNDDHTVKQCPELVANNTKHRSLGRILDTFVNNFFCKSYSVQRPNTLRLGSQFQKSNSLFEICQEHSSAVVNSNWHIDSGCSRHMTGLKDLLTNYRIINSGYVAFAGDKKGVKMIGQGEVSNGSLTLEDVNYVPELAFNLLSVSQICDNNISVLFLPNECLFLKSEFTVPEELVIMRAPRRNDTYMLNMGSKESTSTMICLLSKASSLNLSNGIDV
ncbi:hypothetical protein QVD17_24353 [Tagetes erecta]|uniref:CCHC-type domain-containing protein n=1 Tax=Tagetes erecta TaxID=13708 RepID=A0AAD8KEZ3_TARER|nr:hypothetical protein QVD17_24353 [Tagetes erecta]